MGRGDSCKEEVIAIERTGAILAGKSVIAAQGIGNFPSLLKRLQEAGRSRLVRAGLRLRGLIMPFSFDESASSVGIHYATGSWMDIPFALSVEEQVERDRQIWIAKCERDGIEFDREKSSLLPIEANLLEWARLDAQRRVNEQIAPLSKFKMSLARAKGGEKALLAAQKLEGIYDDAVSDAMMDYIARIRLSETASEKTIQMRLAELQEERRLSLRAFKQTGRGDVRTRWIQGSDAIPVAAPIVSEPVLEDSRGYPVPESLREAVEAHSEAPTLVSAPKTPEAADAAPEAPKEPSEAELAAQMFEAEREVHSPVEKSKTKTASKKDEGVTKEIDPQEVAEFAKTISALSQTTGFRYEMEYLGGQRASTRKMGQGAISQIEAAKAINAQALSGANDVPSLKAALDKFVISCEESTGITAQNYGKLYQVLKNDPARFSKAVSSLLSEGSLEERVEAFHAGLGTVKDKTEKDVLPLRPIQTTQLATYLLAAHGEDVPLYSSALYNSAVERLGGSKLRQGASASEALNYARASAEKVRAALAEKNIEVDNASILGLFYWALSDKGKKYAATLVANRDHDPERFARDVVALRVAGLIPSPQTTSAAAGPSS